MNHTMPRDLPLNEIPSLLTVMAPLAVNDAAAVWIDNILIYSTGIAFTINAGFRQELEPGTINLGTYVHPHPAPSLQLAALYSDGRKATNTTDFRAEPADLDEPFLLSPNSASDPHSASATYYLTPFPSPGPLHLVLTCPILDIKETTLTFDEADLRQAHRSITPLWQESS
ncbi:hypothetical protein ABH922_004703 [Rhodococcus sp. 27YEA15]|uniref:hypothetical protein n=1 Tax=Rhodococcus sp. 27YEA15 TaxID=3156259 RepID=UPI003C7A0DBC